MRLQQEVLGVESPRQVRDWLERHVRTYLGVGVDDVTFEAGAIGAVFGLRLTDGREVVLKALRSGPDGEFGGEREIVAAAATWERCFNARCQVDNEVRRNMASPEGSFLEQLSADYGHSGAARTAP